MSEIAKTGPNPPRLLVCCAALLAAAGVAAGGYFAIRGFDCTACPFGSEETQETPPSLVQSPAGFEKWQRPDVALVLTGQMLGYVDPCGCSSPQFGGLVRRYEFIDSLKKKNWDVVGIDLGELAAAQGIHTQNLLKFDLTVNALAKMNYHAFGIGKNEIELGLGEALAQIYDSKRPRPYPLNNSLAQIGAGGLFQQLNVSGYHIIDLKTAKLKIGVISMMGPDLREELKTKVKLVNDNVDGLKKALNAFADAGVEVGVILHHEYPDEKKLPKNKLVSQAVTEARKKQAQDCAEFCAAERNKNPRIPPIQLMMVLCFDGGTPAFLDQLPNLPTRLVEVGHKGHDVALVGIYRQGNDFKLEHQNVEMSEKWQPRKGQEDKNAVIALYEQQYYPQLKKIDMLAQSPRTLHFNQIQAGNKPGLKATYVGSARCGDCHDHAYRIWEKTSHGHATETLEDPKLRPVGRQYDPECMKCHTTGFKHPGGYNDLVLDLANWPAPPAQKPEAKRVQKHNAGLRGVSCESCHGPGSEHVKNPDNKDLYKLINPFAPSKEERALEAIKNKAPAQAKALAQMAGRRLQNMSNMCRNCHDGENDVHWGDPGNDTADKWLRLIHRTPGRNAPAAKGGNAPAAIELIEGKK